MKPHLAHLVIVLLACKAESDTISFELRAHSFANSEWSAPVNLGAAINSSATDGGPTLSHDRALAVPGVEPRRRGRRE